MTLFSEALAVPDYGQVISAYKIYLCECHSVQCLYVPTLVDASFALLLHALSCQEPYNQADINREPAIHQSVMYMLYCTHMMYTPRGPGSDYQRAQADEDERHC